MIVMNENAKAVEKQAIVCARMGHSTDQVILIAKAKKWNGVIRKRLVNRVLHLKAAQVRAL